MSQNKSKKDNLGKFYFPDGCIYCGADVILTDSAKVYGKSYGNIYLCSNYPKCSSYVGVHKKNDEPLGRLADFQLREWKKKAHDIFDSLWKGEARRMSRKQAYKLMQELMDLDEDWCHIGLFNVEQCRELIGKLETHLADNPLLKTS